MNLWNIEGKFFISKKIKINKRIKRIIINKKYSKCFFVLIQTISKLSNNLFVISKI